MEQQGEKQFDIDFDKEVISISHHTSIVSQQELLDETRQTLNPMIKTNFVNDLSVYLKEVTQELTDLQAGYTAGEKRKSQVVDYEKKCFELTARKEEINGMAEILHH